MQGHLIYGSFDSSVETDKVIQFAAYIHMMCVV